ncbi:MAG: TetR/AcrR family transcriptional regulator [Anaerolineae bacterium]|jgi:AcrR family transcriptional regulator|nr:TetR/AcrR family transcriptional regulator [Anaerolineae bacterium]
MSKAETTKKHILEAANRVIQRDGVAKLTLETVAAEAKVSKGGLLYHFPNKNALIMGMIDYFLGNFEGILDQSKTDDPDPRDWLRGYVRSTFDMTNSQLDDSRALIAAVANQPELLARVREKYADWQALAESSGIDPALATVIRLAADGLWFTELLGINVISDDLYPRVERAILALLDMKER